MPSDAWKPSLVSSYPGNFVVSGELTASTLGRLPIGFASTLQVDGWQWSEMFELASPGDQCISVTDGINLQILGLGSRGEMANFLMPSAYRVFDLKDTSRFIYGIGTKGHSWFPRMSQSDISYRPSAIFSSFTHEVSYAQLAPFSERFLKYFEHMKSFHLNNWKGTGALYIWVAKINPALKLYLSAGGFYLSDKLSSVHA